MTRVKSPSLSPSKVIATVIIVILCRFLFLIFVSHREIISSIYQVNFIDILSHLRLRSNVVYIVWHMQLLDIHEQLTVCLIHGHDAHIVPHNLRQAIRVLSLNRVNDPA